MGALLGLQQPPVASSIKLALTDRARPAGRFQGDQGGALFGRMHALVPTLLLTASWSTTLSSAPGGISAVISPPKWASTPWSQPFHLFIRLVAERYSCGRAPTRRSDIRPLAHPVGPDD